MPPASPVHRNRNPVAEGQVYSWGEASVGRLGHSVTELAALPKPVSSILGNEITAVGLGSQYSIFVTGPYLHSIRSESTILH